MTKIISPHTGRSLSIWMSEIEIDSLKKKAKEGRRSIGNFVRSELFKEKNK
jgi:hypothetical protein